VENKCSLPCLFSIALFLYAVAMEMYNLVSEYGDSIVIVSIPKTDYIPLDRRIHHIYRYISLISLLSVLLNDMSNSILYILSLILNQYYFVEIVRFLRG
jgi:hypothetical protein